MKLFRAGLLLALIGCSAGTPAMPEIAPAEGIVTINGQPLPNALVTFTPSGNVSSAAIATGVSDDAGKFTLTCGDKPGAAVGECIVTVIEGPVAETLRGEDQQGALAAATAKLKNRPIPGDYGIVAKSPIKVTVSAGKKDYPIELKR
jgi:hypothetical protein